MSFVCLGLNHKTAPVALRERIAFRESELPDALLALCKCGLTEAVILSTCNRVEIYAAAPESAGGNTAEAETAALESVRTFLHERFGLDDTTPANTFYQRHGQDARRHLARVASGLDSMVLGETEIFGQVKKAYQHAHAAGATGSLLNRLFQNVFRIGKLVRSSTHITHGATSVGSAAVELAGKIFGDLEKCRVMVLGAGDMSRRVAASLKSRGAASIIVSNRSFDKATALADEVGGRAVNFEAWEEEVAGIDIIIAATGAPHPVIHPEHVTGALRKRRGLPLFMIDIAVPRDIDAACANMDGVYLYDIDALQAIAADGLRQREKQIAACDILIEEQLEKLPKNLATPPIDNASLVPHA